MSAPATCGWESRGGEKTAMLKRVLDILLAPLDWCWPLPLGIVFGALVVGVSAGTWWIFWAPSTPLQGSAAPTAQSPAHSGVAPPPSQPAPPTATEPAIPTEPQPSEVTKTSPVSAAAESARPTASRPLTAQETKLRDTLTRARWYMQHGQYRPAIEEFQAALEMDPSNREASAELQQAREASGKPATSPQRVQSTASRPPATQETKLRDTLTRARWYMKHAQYRVAVEEFQAALEMDPSNREARAGLQQAREAGGNRQPGP